MDPRLEPIGHLQAEQPRVEEGTALCLSGGGYRAMLFHLGSLWRLNEAGRLATLARISSVSGGSITAATLGRHWATLAFDPHGVAQRFDIVVDAIRHLARHTIEALGCRHAGKG